MVELTDAAISKAIERTTGSSPSYIRLGVNPGGCAGWEYVIDYANETSNDDTIIDYGKFKIVIDKLSQPFLEGSTLDWIKEGLNEQFKIINPKEEAACGCGVSVQFKGL
jgi:iron-sulfur cluster assembly accessory protein